MVQYSTFLMLLIAITLGWAGQAVADEHAELTFRLAEASDAEGLIESSLPETGKKIYLHAKPVVTASDVATVSFSRDPNKRHVISLEFKPLAAKRLAEATEQHLGKKIVCQLDGKIVMAPTVRGVISKRAMINSQFTDDEMRRIFDALVLQKYE
jgi:preprotein translocase subunit SecD